MRPAGMRRAPTSTPPWGAVAALAVVFAVAICSPAVAAATDCGAHHANTAATCSTFSPNKIDYHDGDIATFQNVLNESACCALCAAHNAARPAGAPASTNCTIAVWHGPRHYTCNLKATAAAPFNSTLVVALQPVPAPPVVPLRFASIYTDHAVLQAGPASAVVWGFANVPSGTAVHVTVDGEHSSTVAATLEPLPPDAAGGYADGWIWRATLLPVGPTFASHTITVAAPGCNASAAISDVVFGDVYVCGGQSNMEYSINGSNGAVIKHPPINDSAAEVATMMQPRYGGVRMLRSGHNAPATPALELPAPAGGGEPFGAIVGWTQPCPALNGTVTCRVDVSAMCWLYGRNVYDGLAAAGRGRPIGLVESCWSGSPDEAWSTAAGLRRCGIDATSDGKMYNGMIRPLLNTTIAGAIWYQGESDSSHPAGVGGYNCTFPQMVDAWRAGWYEGTAGQTDRHFPFLFVQLNSNGNGTVYNNPRGNGTATTPFVPTFAGLRWAQTSGHGQVPNAAQPRTYMAVAYDTPDRPVPAPINGRPGADPGFGVHSPFKQPTAARLARVALAEVYNVSVDTTGPLPGAVTRTADGKGLEVAIEAVGQGVAPLRSARGFEALVDNVWLSVPVTQATPRSVIIPSVPRTATQLRYNWYDNPCGFDCFGCAVYVHVTPVGNWSGELDILPLPPFYVDLE